MIVILRFFLLVVSGDDQKCLKSEIYVVTLEEDLKKATEDLNVTKVWFFPLTHFLIMIVSVHMIVIMTAFVIMIAFAIMIDVDDFRRSTRAQES